MKNYRMCGLAQENQRTTGWIEERGAKLGGRVEIEELGGIVVRGYVLDALAIRAI